MSRLGIDPESWPQLSHLLDEALELPAEARAAWLESLDCNDEQLKERLRALLAHTSDVETGDVLNTFPKLTLREDAFRAAHAPLENPGDQIGPYRLVRQLGAGGMGTVWLAERTDGLIPRPVALKLPQRALQHAGLAERMAREREILASLNHPNIARLYDAGISSDGQPYLALEYIAGVPIDAYCDQHRLDMEARLQLFLQVARAVAHAHTKLVVHRDLKPGNILVTEDGQARLLDFGVAKLLDPQALNSGLTELAGPAMTPDYASPEQIAGEPITTASDVYALGVVLYELLTHERPYKLKRQSRGALEEAILHSDPEPPSRIAREPATRKRLRGELDSIVLKALKKNIDERYATVNAFAEDIERHLTHRPVLAQPDSLWYRSRKFVRRNKLAVAAAASVLLTVLAGSVVSIWQARVALAEQHRAEEVKEFLASTLRDADPYQGPGRAPSVKDLLRQARERVDRIESRPDLRVELLTLIGSSLLNLEDLDAAENAARQALSEAIDALGADHPQTLRARVLMLGVHRFRGRTDEMRRELETLETSLKGRQDVSVEERVLILENRGHLSIDDGKGKAALEAAQQAFDLALAHFGERDPRTASAATLLAEAHEYTDASPEQALQAAERAFQLTTAIYHPDSPHPRIIAVRDVYGRALCRAGRLQEGIRHLETALRDATEVFGPMSTSVGFLASNTARYQVGLGDLKGALENFNRTLEIHARDAQRNSFTYLSPLTARGITLIAARRSDEALRNLNEASQGLTQLFGAEHEETLIAEFHRALALAFTGEVEASQRAFAPVLQQYRTTYKDPVYLPARVFVYAGTALRLAGDPAAALAYQNEALGAIVPGAPYADRLRVPALTELGLTYLDLGQPERALGALEEALSLREKQQPAALTPAHVDILVGLGRASLALGGITRALDLLQEADAFWREFDADNRWAGEAAFWLSRALRAAGRTSEANEALRRARRILERSPLRMDAHLLQANRPT
jgi:serine/threonine protein kinase/Tfp pilus assembly protein PilF